MIRMRNEIIKRKEMRKEMRKDKGLKGKMIDEKVEEK